MDGLVKRVIEVGGRRETESWWSGIAHQIIIEDSGRTRGYTRKGSRWVDVIARHQKREYDRSERIQIVVSNPMFSILSPALEKDYG